MKDTTFIKHSFFTSYFQKHHQSLKNTVNIFESTVTAFKFQGHGGVEW